MQSTIKHVFLTKHPSLCLVAGKNKYVKIKTIWDFAVNRGVPVWIRFPNEKRCIFPCCNPKLLGLPPGPRSSSWRLSPASEREYISSFLSSSVGFSTLANCTMPIQLHLWKYQEKIVVCSVMSRCNFQNWTVVSVYCP